MVYMTGGLVMLTEMLSVLPPSERKAANYILDHPHEVITLTANELGKRSLTSGAAVIRLCKSLKLKGFQDLKLRIAGDLQKTKELGYQDVESNESTLSIIEKNSSNRTQAIKET